MQERLSLRRFASKADLILEELAWGFLEKIADKVINVTSKISFSVHSL